MEEPFADPARREHERRQEIAAVLAGPDADRECVFENQAGAMTCATPYARSDVARHAATDVADHAKRREKLFPPLRIYATKKMKML